VVVGWLVDESARRLEEGPLEARRRTLWMER
jgi:hypothetical protein